MAGNESWKDVTERVAMFGEAGGKLDRAKAMLEHTPTNRAIASPKQAHLGVAAQALSDLLDFPWLTAMVADVQFAQASVEDWRAQAYERVSCAAERIEAAQKTTLEQIGGV